MPVYSQWYFEWVYLLITRAFLTICIGAKGSSDAIESFDKEFPGAIQG